MIGVERSRLEYLMSESIFGEKILNFAHRGYTARAPENSVAAFEAALDLGVDGIELDVRTCKSGEVIVFHDPTLQRLTNGRGFVKAKTLSEVKSLHLLSDHELPPQRIPTLQEVIELVKGRALLNVEIKTRGLPKDGIEEKVLAILRQYNIEYETLISSFNPLVIRRLRKLDPELVTGFLVDGSFSVRRSEIPLSRIAGAKAIHLEQSLAKKTVLEKLQKLGFYCVVWGVNDPRQMQRLVDLRVHGIITDRPEALKAILTT